MRASYLSPAYQVFLLQLKKIVEKYNCLIHAYCLMAYHEDVAAVKDSFKKMLENGVYKADLFSDL